MESPSQALEVAHSLSEMAARLGVGLIYKTSFDKANRTSMASARSGVPRAEALKVFQEIKQRYGCPVLTDVHEPAQCADVAAVVDVLQIPALLCRQTDLIVAAAATGRVLNIKKGQFLSPGEMRHVAHKVGHQRVLLCERGTCFGYQNLVNDMRALPIMGGLGYPVIFDATHSVQKPAALSGHSGGERQFVETLARAAIAVGVAGVFMETHPDPERALSDGPNMVPLQEMEGLMATLMMLDRITKSLPYQSFSYQNSHLPSEA